MNKNQLRVPPAMAFHSLSDFPLHDAEGCQHIFFREGAGAPRPAQIVRKVSGGKELICWRCGDTSIPMPMGATSETQYVCPACSPLGVVCGGQLDRFQFDNWASGERWKSDRDPQFSFRDLVEYFIAHDRDISLVPSARILFYRQNGVPWALKATASNLARLANGARCMFVAFYWAGLTEAEIASAMQVDRHYVQTSITKTKIKLRSMV